MNVSDRIDAVAAAFLGVATLAAGDLPVPGSEERQENIEELRDRFKTWLSNIDVLPGGYKWLDERLHHASELRETVTELLQNLSDDLHEAQESIRISNDAPALEHAVTNDPVSVNMDPSGLSEELTFEMIAEDIDETLTCLMRLSVPLADHIAGEIQMSSIRGSMDTRYSFDLKAEFPHASVFVADRLSKTISDRRNALLPLEHRSSTMDDQEADDGLQVRIEKGLRREGEANQILSAILRDVQPVLEARSDSTVCCDNELDDSSVSSASSVDTHRAETKDCSICHQEVSYTSISELRKHYHHDLTPYVCLFQDCTLSSARYRSRSTWIEHIKSTHGKVWRCCFGCPQMLGSRDGFYQHIKTAHNVDLGPQELLGLAAMCEKHILTDDGPRCPLCQELAGTGRARYRHIARHLEKLAVFSLMPPGSTFKGNAPPTNPEVATNAQLASWGLRDPDQVGNAARTQTDILSATDESAWDGRSDYTSNEGASTLATSVQGDEISNYDIRDMLADDHAVFKDESGHVPPAKVMQTPETPQEPSKGTKIVPSPERSDVEKKHEGHISSSLDEWDGGVSIYAPDKGQPSEGEHSTSSELDCRIEGNKQADKDQKGLSPVPAQSSQGVARGGTVSSSIHHVIDQTDWSRVSPPGQSTEGGIGHTSASTMTSNPSRVMKATGKNTLLQPEQTVPKTSIPIPSTIPETPETPEVGETTGSGQIRSGLEPSCAICGAPPYPECPHEGESLERALNQAQDRWTGVQRIRDWVLDNSRNHIIHTFEQLKAVRYNAHLGYLQSLPYYSLYVYYTGRPPLHRHELGYLERQLDSADANLKLGVDQDWRSCCLMYPETLDYYFGLVCLQLPKDQDESVLRPEIGRKRIVVRDSGHVEDGRWREKRRA